MISVRNMDKNARMDYIFRNQPNNSIVNRFGWLGNALLDDIQTFSNTLESAPYLVQGGGNLSIPIVVCTGLELASALYVGMTDYLDHSKYDATVNVESFINDFFPRHSRRISRLTWDGVRNGVDHLFVRKSIQYSNLTIQFTFYGGIESKAIKTGNSIEIRINSVELYNTLKQAIEKYRIRLLKEVDLQINFMTAWDSIESHVRPISANDTRKTNEVQYLLRELNRTNPVKLF